VRGAVRGRRERAEAERGIAGVGPREEHVAGAVEGDAVGHGVIAHLRPGLPGPEEIAGEGRGGPTGAAAGPGARGLEGRPPWIPKTALQAVSPKAAAGSQKESARFGRFRRMVRPPL